MNEKYPFGIVGRCVVCDKATSHTVNCDGEYIPVCYGECTQKFRGEEE